MRTSPGDRPDATAAIRVDTTATPTAGVDAAMAGLDDLGRLALDEHVGRFEAVHAALTDALSAIDGI